MLNDIQVEHNSRFQMDRGRFVFSILMSVLLIAYIWTNSFKVIAMFQQLLMAPRTTFDAFFGNISNVLPILCSLFVGDKFVWPGAAYDE